jgi:hypothetical protein
LAAIFRPDNGLGLTCPVIMVHGNHEGFPHLERLSSTAIPRMPVDVEQLPPVDSHGHLRLLPSGWTVRLRTGHLVAGVGGIEPGQRRARYHPMAMVDETAILHVLDRGPVDFLVTHQGPSGLQGEKGSPSLQVLLDQHIAQTWFHGHSIAVAEPTRIGPKGGTLVVPLGDIAFRAPKASPRAERCEPGDDGWAIATVRDGQTFVDKSPPRCLRQFHRRRWVQFDDQLVAPPLAEWAWKEA